MLYLLSHLVLEYLMLGSASSNCWSLICVQIRQGQRQIMLLDNQEHLCHLSYS
jgi:hypothetical protein